jgi:hypothetical protein
MCYLVACSPYIPRFFDMLFGNKKQTNAGSLAYRAPSSSITKLASKKGDPEASSDASWIALHEPDDKHFHGSAHPEVTGVPREW